MKVFVTAAVSRAGNFELPPTFVWNIWDVLTQAGNWHPRLFDEWVFGFFFLFFVCFVFSCDELLNNDIIVK